MLHTSVQEAHVAVVHGTSPSNLGMSLIGHPRMRFRIPPISRSFGVCPVPFIRTLNGFDGQ